MKVFYYGKDGGKESTVSGYWLIEAKKLFSIVLLKFENGSRDTYHSHAFNSVSWVLKGKLTELNKDNTINIYEPSIIPIITKKTTFHKVISENTTWVLSFRGPWNNTWKEYTDKKGEYTLSNGRVQIT